MRSMVVVEGIMIDYRLHGPLAWVVAIVGLLAFANWCIGQEHGAQVPDESYADHPTAPDADATSSPCIDA